MKGTVGVGKLSARFDSVDVHDEFSLRKRSHFS